MLKHLTSKEIDEIEGIIGLALPDDVCAKYLKSNGFISEHCELLYSYLGNTSTDIVAINKQAQEEGWMTSHMERLIIIGSDGIGGLIGYDHTLKQGVLWYPSEEKYESYEASVSAVWDKVTKSYDQNS